MDIEKTLEYLENVMSSEVRILTIQKEINSVQALLDDKNDYYEHFINGEFDKIFVPPWIPDVSGGSVYFGPHFRGEYHSELAVGKDYDTKKFKLEGGGKGEDLARKKLFSDFVLNIDYYDKAFDINIRMLTAIREIINQNKIGYKMYNNGDGRDRILRIGDKEKRTASFAQGHCEPLALTRNCFYICIISRLKSFLGITDPFCNDLCDDGYSWAVIQNYALSSTTISTPARIGLGRVEEFGDWSKLINFTEKELIIEQIIELDPLFYSFFKMIPRSLDIPSFDEFQKDFYGFFRKNIIKVREETTIEPKRIWDKRITTSSVTDICSEQEINLLATTLYPFYCEMFSAVNDYLVKCYDLLLERSTSYAFNKDFARRKLPELERMLSEEKEALGKLYDLNVIYGKYRGIVPVGSFIDYFASGRCDSFDGPNGAYNTYELELRLDKIICKLDVIIAKLDEIKANQRAMYFALTEMNANLRAIHGSISSAARNITNTLKTEGEATRGNLNSISSSLNNISSTAAAISVNQEYSNRLLELSNERQESIIRNQQFEQLLYTDPTIFGGRKISDKAYGKYH